MADNKSRELSIKVDVDVSEALTGLKALQREAKKATQVLRELECNSSAEVFEIGRSEAIAKMTGMQVTPLINGPATIYVVRNGGVSE